MCIQKERKPSCSSLCKGNHLSGNRLFTFSSWQTPSTVNAMNHAERGEGDLFFASDVYREDPSR